MTFDELWPLPIPKVTVVTGPYGCGKSTFALGSGAEMEEHLVVDFEKSQEGYSKQLPFTYVDVGSVMNAKYPNGYAPADLYSEVVPMIDAVPVGKYRILVLDNASPLEDAHAGQVDKFPTKYGLSPNQLEKSGGLKWGAIKNLYFQNIVRWSSKFDMIFIIVQLRDKYSGNSVVKDEYGKAVQEPKGKETLEMLSSLFVWLTPGPGGVPSANVLKCRIDKKIYVPDPENAPDIPKEYLAQLEGEPGLVSIPVLPLRLPKCTWPAIRKYMKNPANLFSPLPGEVPSKKEMSEDDRLKLRSLISQNEASIAEVEREKLAAAARLKSEQQKAAFLAQAAGAGYKLPNGAPDRERIKSVLTKHNLYPFEPGTEAEAMKVLKAEIGGNGAA